MTASTSARHSHAQAVGALDALLCNMPRPWQHSPACESHQAARTTKACSNSGTAPPPLESAGSHDDDRSAVYLPLHTRTLRRWTRLCATRVPPQPWLILRRSRVERSLITGPPPRSQETFCSRTTSKKITINYKHVYKRPGNELF